MGYDSISINVQQLDDMAADLSGCKRTGAYGELEDAKTYIDKIETCISENFEGKTAKKLQDYVSDIHDSERGIRNNIEDFAKHINKFYNRREDEISIKNRNLSIRVDRDIKGVNNDLQSIYHDIKSAVKSHTPDVGMGLHIVKEEHREIIHNINSCIDTTKEDSITNLNTIETLMDDAKEAASVMEDWFEDDYNDAAHAVANIAILAGSAVAATAIATVLPFAVGGLTVFAVGAGVVKAGTLYMDGSSMEGAVFRGGITTGFTYFGGKQMGKAFKGAAATKIALAEKAGLVSNMAPEIAENYTNNIKNRMINLTLEGEELMIKNAEQFGSTYSEEITNMTAELTDSIQNFNTTELEEFLSKAIQSGSEALETIFSNFAGYDELIALKLSEGSMVAYAAEKIKEEIKTDTEEFLNENFEAFDGFSFDDTIKVIMDKVEALLDDMIKVGS